VSDALERVLRLVAAGRLSPEEAAPILDALDAPRPSTRAEEAAQSEPPAARGPVAGGQPGRFVRLEVTEGGRQVVNLRLPASLGSIGMMGLPGLSDANLERVSAALSAGFHGPIVEVADADGDGVRIVID
jgi:hypothetical protein